MKTISISEEQAQALLDYLATKPYREVHQFVAMLVAAARKADHETNDVATDTPGERLL